MTPDYFRSIYDYHYWGRDKILHEVERVADADFVKAMSKGYGSLRATLVHMIGAEWIWLTRLAGTSPSAFPSEEELPTLAAIRARWGEEEKKLRAYFAGLTDAELRRVVSYKNMRGEAFARPVWQVLAQVANHGTQHRAEAAAMLTDLGFSPGNLDMTLFFDELAKR